MTTEQKDESHSKRPEIIVKVNGQNVTFTVKKATGLAIKQTAIDQQVEIQIDFALFLRRGNSTNWDPISDDKEIPLHPNQEFRAVAPDDNS